MAPLNPLQVGPCDDITVDARNSIAVSGGRLDLGFIWREVVFVFAPDKPGEQPLTIVMPNITEEHVGKPVLKIPLQQLVRASNRNPGKPVMAVQAKASVQNFLQKTSKTTSFTVRRATASVPSLRLKSPVVASSDDELSYHARMQFKEYGEGCQRRLNNPGWHFTVSFAWRVTTVRTGSFADPLSDNDPKVATMGPNLLPGMLARGTAHYGDSRRSTVVF